MFWPCCFNLRLKFAKFSDDGKLRTLSQISVYLCDQVVQLAGSPVDVAVVAESQHCMQLTSQQLSYWSVCILVSLVHISGLVQPVKS